MKKNKLKNIILIFMLIAKIFTMGVILFHSATQGLTKSETISAFTLILPLFTVYLTVMIKDIVDNPYKTKKKKTEVVRVKSSISLITFIVFPVYFLAIVMSINQTAQGNEFFSGDGLQQIIAIIESAFGVYVGLIVFSLFKKEEKKKEKK